MNKVVLEELDAVKVRYQELERLLTPSADENNSNMGDKKLWSEYRQKHQLMNLYDQYRKLETEIASTSEMADDSSDPDMAELARDELIKLKKQLEQAEEQIYIELVPKDVPDDAGAIVEIRAGTGGDEAGIFAADLRRMYYRFAERNKWKVDALHSMETGIGSLKETIFEVSGKLAYNKLSTESGVHRVQRVPATESQGRVHTSTATVAVLPKVEQAEFEIDPSDVKMELIHASGHGGQNVNKVATAVRLTHLPSKLVVVCQNERSQIQNRRQAMDVLRSRLWEKQLREEQESRANIRRSQIRGGERSEKIRTYNYPQNRVTDHRISFTSHRLREILSGELDELVDTLLAAHRVEMLAQIRN